MVRVVESQLVEKPRQLTFNSRFFTFIFYGSLMSLISKAKGVFTKKMYILLDSIFYGDNMCAVGWG